MTRIRVWPALWHAWTTLLCSAGSVACSTAPPPLATLSPDSLPLGTTLCAQSRTAPITLSNTGGSPLHWSATSDALPGVLVAPASGTLAPGASETLTATLSLAATPKPGDMLSGNIVLTTDAPDQPTLTVPISATASGAVVRTVGPSVLDFGEIPLGALSPPQSVSLENAGDAPARLATEGSLPFLLSFLAGGTLAPGGTDVLTGAFAPSALGPFERTASLALPDGLCGDPAKVTLKGKGVEGVVGISPGSLDFGDVDCGTSATKTVTILNTSLAPFEFTTAFTRGTGSRYQVTPAQGAVPARGTVELAVAAAISADDGVDATPYDDDLTIVTTAPKDTSHTVALASRPRGSILRFAAPLLALGRSRIGQPSVKSIALANDGNVAAVVNLAASSPFQAPSSVTVPAKAQVQVSVGAGDGEALELTQGTVTASTPVVQCGTSAPLTVTATYYDRAAQGARTFAVGAMDCFTVIATSGRVYQRWGPSPFERLPVTGATQVVAYNAAACALLGSGGVQCWGTGILGDGTQAPSVTPVAVVGLTTATDIAGRGERACVRLADATVRCWGTNNSAVFGTYGGNGPAEQLSPTPVLGLPGGIAEIELGLVHQCVRTTAGELWCWSSSWVGDLGPRGSAPAHQPAPVLGFSNVTGMGLAASTTCARMGGSLYCFGGLYGSTPSVVGGGATQSPVGMGDMYSFQSMRLFARSDSGYMLEWQAGQGNVAAATFPIDAVHAGNHNVCYAYVGHLFCHYDSGYLFAPVPGFD